MNFLEQLKINNSLVPITKESVVLDNSRVLEKSWVLEKNTSSNSESIIKDTTEQYVDYSFITDESEINKNATISFKTDTSSKIIILKNQDDSYDVKVSDGSQTVPFYLIEVPIIIPKESREIGKLMFFIRNDKSSTCSQLKYDGQVFDRLQKISDESDHDDVCYRLSDVSNHSSLSDGNQSSPFKLNFSTLFIDNLYFSISKKSDGHSSRNDASLNRGFFHVFLQNSMIGNRSTSGFVNINFAPKNISIFYRSESLNNERTYNMQLGEPSTPQTRTDEQQQRLGSETQSTELNKGLSSIVVRNHILNSI